MARKGFSSSSPLDLLLDIAIEILAEIGFRLTNDESLKWHKEASNVTKREVSFYDLQNQPASLPRGRGIPSVVKETKGLRTWERHVLTIPNPWLDKDGVEYTDAELLQMKLHLPLMSVQNMIPIMTGGVGVAGTFVPDGHPIYDKSKIPETKTPFEGAEDIFLVLADLLESWKLSPTLDFALSVCKKLAWLRGFSFSQEPAQRGTPQPSEEAKRQIQRSAAFQRRCRRRKTRDNHSSRSSTKRS
jgi:hypothetical protein